MDVYACMRFNTAAIFGSLLSLLALTVPLAADTPLAERGGNDQFAVAAHHYQQQRWELAVEAFETFLAEHGEHRRYDDAMFFLGESCIQLGRFDEAHAHFDRLLRDRPEHRYRKQAMFRRGEAAHLAGDAEHAAGDLKKFLDQYGGDSLAAYAEPYLASRLLDAGDAAGALDLYAHSLERFPAGPLADEARFGRAQALKKLGRRDEAQQAFAEIAADATARFASQAGFQLGLIQYTSGDYAAADATFQKVRADAQEGKSLDERQANRLDYWRGMSLKGLKQWTAAAELLTTAAENSADDEKRLAATYHAGDAWLRAEQWDKAAAQLATIAEAAGGTEWADDVAFGRGVALQRLGELETARERFEQVIALENSPLRSQAQQAREAIEQQSLAGLAWSQYLDKAHEASAATFEQLLKKYPDSSLAAEAAYTRGQALEKLGKPEPALDMYLLVAEKFSETPQYEPALLRAATISDRLQHNDEAMRLFDRLLTERPESELVDDALYQSAWLAREQTNADDSQARFLRLHEEYRTSRYWHDATYRLAVAALEASKHDEARRLADDLLAADPPAAIREHALYLRGQIAAASDKWAEVDPPLAVLMENFPSSSLRLAAEYWRAEAAYQQQDYETAAARFDAIAPQLEAVEGTWPAMVPLRRAQLLAHNKQWPEAREVAETIATNYPQFGQRYEVVYLLGRCRFAAAEFDEARAEFNRAIELAAGRKLETAAMAQWMIGESYFHQKQYETAVREYFRVEALYDFPRWQSGALLQAGKCYEHLGRFRDAVALYDRIVEQYPKTDFSDEAGRRGVVARQRLETTRR